MPAYLCRKTGGWMNRIITPLSFLKVDGKLEGKYPMILAELPHEKTSGTIFYEEVIVWPPEDSKNTAAGGTSLKARVRLL
jgi:hypothetical protein